MPRVAPMRRGGSRPPARASDEAAGAGPHAWRTRSGSVTTTSGPSISSSRLQPSRMAAAGECFPRARGGVVDRTRARGDSGAVVVRREHTTLKCRVAPRRHGGCRAPIALLADVTGGGRRRFAARPRRPARPVRRPPRPCASRGGWDRPSTRVRCGRQDAVSSSWTASATPIARFRAESSRREERAEAALVAGAGAQRKGRAPRRTDWRRRRSCCRPNRPVQQRDHADLGEARGRPRHPGPRSRGRR